MRNEYLTEVVVHVVPLYHILTLCMTKIATMLNKK